ncbi:hypothetical protein KC19_6G223900 [Ceratodon purpureus]|uniref:Uncharacterized protein n=1 Tax=Ceratodon purpureus TaxID=3225 RepID=A0A8T0HKE9_CERPU|nr:hypothetical protein KC19_6G223900 [Ceratodon purpureus]
MQFLERVGLMFLKFGSHRGLSGVTKTTTSLVCRNLVLCLEAAEGVLEEYGGSRTYCWTEGQPCASAGSTSNWRYDLGNSGDAARAAQASLAHPACIEE